MPDENQVTTPVQPAAATPVTPLVTEETPVATTPISISASDVAAEPTKMVVNNPTSSTAITEKPSESNLADKVEVLTGEVEALHAKIENLVKNVKPSQDLPATAGEPEVKNVEPAPSEMKKAEDISASPLSQKTEVAPIVSEDTAKNETVKEPVASVPVKPMPAVPKPDLPLNDIYPSAQMPSAPQKVDEPFKAPSTVGGDTEHHDSILGTIGEVVGSIGLTVLLVMILSPLYKGIFPASVWEAIKLIGWLTAVGSLFVGFFFSLFSPRKITLKALLLVGLLITLVLFLGVDGSASITDKLNTYIGQYLNYYR